MFVNCLFHEQGSNKSHRMMCKRLMIKLLLHFRQCRPNKTETLQPRERGNTESRYRFQILLNQCATCPVVYLSRVVTRAILRCTGTCGNAVITTCKFHPCNRLITGKAKISEKHIQKPNTMPESSYYLPAAEWWGPPLSSTSMEPLQPVFVELPHANSCHSVSIPTSQIMLGGTG